MSDSSFDDLLHQPFRWPAEGDRLFAPSTRRLGDALVGSYSLSSQLYGMTQGYKRAADLLVERATVERPDRDFLVYPVIFCYRHYLELSLKMIIQEYGPSVGVKPNWKDHRLEKLWPVVKKILDDYNVSNGTDDIVEECIAEFAKIDPNSFTYRYPVDTNGTPLPVCLERLDLLQLRKVMNGIENYISGSYDYLDNLKNA
jgi:hypothetical protein